MRKLINWLIGDPTYHIVHIPLVNGYDTAGTYWGKHRLPLWMIVSERRWTMVRARGPRSVRAWVRESFDAQAVFAEGSPN